MWVIAILGAGLLVPATLLFIPVELRFRVAREERTQGGLSVGWMFGLLRKEIPVGLRERRESPKRPRRRRGGTWARGKRAVAGLATVSRVRHFPSRCLWLARELLRQVNIRELHLRGRVGLDDPADTGLLFAVLAPTLVCLGGSSTACVSLEPDFDGVRLAGQADGAVRLVPGRVVWILVRFVVSPASLRVAWALASRRRR